MKTRIVKQLFVFLFILAVMERSGISLTSFIMSQYDVQTEQMISEAEGTAKENQKDLSLKEYWTCSLSWVILSPVFSYKERIYVPQDGKLVPFFYPSVPTPPPDRTYMKL